LQSTNGTFVRAASAVVGNAQEIMAGGRRLRSKPTGAAPRSGLVRPRIRGGAT
jgi:hypothetical protein